MGLKHPLCLSWGHWRCLLRRDGGVLALCPQALGCGGQGEHCPVPWSHPGPPSWRCGLSVGHPDVLRAQGSRTEGGSPGMSEGWGWVQRPLIRCPGGLGAGLCQEEQPRSSRSCVDLVLAAPGVCARASRTAQGPVVEGSASQHRPPPPPCRFSSLQPTWCTGARPSSSTRCVRTMSTCCLPTPACVCESLWLPGPPGGASSSARTVSQFWPGPAPPAPPRPLLLCTCSLWERSAPAHACWPVGPTQGACWEVRSLGPDVEAHRGCGVGKASGLCPHFTLLAPSLHWAPSCPARARGEDADA